MDFDSTRHETVKGIGLFDPDQHVVSGAVTVITQSMIQRQFCYLARLQQVDDLVKPEYVYPVFRCSLKVI